MAILTDLSEKMVENAKFTFVDVLHLILVIRKLVYKEIIVLTQAMLFEVPHHLVIPLVPLASKFLNFLRKWLDDF